jgi:hypothetical protein
MSRKYFSKTECARAHAPATAPHIHRSPGGDYAQIAIPPDQGETVKESLTDRLPRANRPIGANPVSSTGRGATPLVAGYR